MAVISMVDMSTFRHVNVSSMSPRAHTARNTGISRFKTLRKHSRILRRKQCGNCVPTCPLLSTFISHIRVIIHMNTKMILAAVALSLSLAACQKKTEEAPPADTAAAPAETAPAPDAAATGDAASQAGDAAATQAPAETPPADQPPAQPQQ
jgi:predicted small lipoprotein YifL